MPMEVLVNQLTQAQEETFRQLRLNPDFQAFLLWLGETVKQYQDRWLEGGFETDDDHNWRRLNHLNLGRAQFAAEVIQMFTDVATPDTSKQGVLPNVE